MSPATGRCRECGAPTDGGRFCGLRCLQTAARRVLDYLDGIPVDVAGQAPLTFEDVTAAQRLETVWLNALLDAVELGMLLGRLLDDEMVEQAVTTGRPVFRHEHPLEAEGEDAWRLVRLFREGAPPTNTSSV